MYRRDVSDLLDSSGSPLRLREPAHLVRLWQARSTKELSGSQPVTEWGWVHMPHSFSVSFEMCFDLES